MMKKMLEFGANKMERMIVLTSSDIVKAVVRREDNVKQLIVECRYNEKNIFHIKYNFIRPWLNLSL